MSQDRRSANPAGSQNHLQILRPRSWGDLTACSPNAETQLPDTKAERREFVRRVIALDPVIDQALGESSHVRYHSSKLQTAMYGLFGALDGWRGIATHLSRLPEAARRQGAQIILQSLPSELRPAPEAGSPALWIADLLALHRICKEAVRTLIVLPAGTPSLRLLADETVKVLAGMLRVLDGLALLVDAPYHPSPGARDFRLSEPDWLPALINAARAFLAISAVELFWVVTGWPNGASTIIFVTVVVLLLSPKGDLAYAGSLAFALGVAGAVVCAAAVKFAMLPALQTFPAFCAALGFFYLPAGFAMAASRQPIVIAALTAMTFNFNPLLAPTNEMNYDTAQYYNSALAIVVGCGVAWHFGCCLRCRQPFERSAFSPSPPVTCVASRSLPYFRRRTIGRAAYTTASGMIATKLIPMKP